MFGINIRATGAKSYSTTNEHVPNSLPCNELSLGEKRVYFYALPLTTRKTFIHCKYTNNIFPNGKPTLENKIISKFTTLWNNFATSDVSVNKKVTKFINNILSRIPWLETCLLSIPSQKFITRKLLEDAEQEKKFVTYDDILEKNIKSEDLEKLDFYYPHQLTNMELIMKNFKPEFKSQYDIHKKGILKDLLLMPLTIPFAIVPLLPNIPGFYLLYRVYCHIKVISSLKFLVTLLKDGHLNYNRVDGIAEIYLGTQDNEVRANVMKELAFVSTQKEFADNNHATADADGHEERLLMSEDVARELCKAFDDEACADKLIYAIQQERRHIQERVDKVKQENTE